MPKEKIIGKIQKLLALSKSDNQYEAELAMLRAQQLMQKHQMEMADVLVEIKSSDIITEEMKIDGKRQLWYMYLANNVAKLFDAKVLGCNQGRRGGTKFSFIGAKDNIVSSKMVFTHLFKSWESIMTHDLKKVKTEIIDEGYRWHQGDALRFKTAHGIGFQQAIGKRVKQILADREAEFQLLSDNTSLVPVKMEEAIKEFIKDAFGKTRKISRLKTSDKKGYFSGQAAGNHIPLQGGIKTQSNYLT